MIETIGTILGGGVQAISGSTTVGANVTFCRVTANANITLPAPTEGRRVLFKKATVLLLPSVVLVRAGGENIENAASNYAVTVFNTANLCALQMRADGTNWWIESLSLA